MNLTFDLFNRDKIKALNSQVQNLSRQITVDSFRGMINNSVAIYPTYDEKIIAAGLSGVDLIYAIIRRLVNAANNVPIFGYEQVNGQ